MDPNNWRRPLVNHTALVLPHREYLGIQYRGCIMPSVQRKLAKSEGGRVQTLPVLSLDVEVPSSDTST